MYDLSSKFDLYMKLLPTVQDGAGFIESSECDSLLFSGLLGCVPGAKIDLWKAFDPQSGTWHRRPLGAWSCCSCYEEGINPSVRKKLSNFLQLLKTGQSIDLVDIFKFRGGSTISRDMLTGLAWYAWHNKDLAMSESVVQYALKHRGIMGKGDPARTNIMPSLLATFAWISYKLGGPSRAWLRWIPADFGGQVFDYQAHLQVLHILLRSEIVGKISEFQKRILRNHVTRQPNNPLFAYAIGDREKAMRILSDSWIWPPCRLPTTGDRSGAWLPERDYGSDWKPSTTETDRKHSGGDFLFCYWLINRAR